MWMLAFLLTNLSLASGLKTMDPVGPHYPILSFEKNENPQNIMIIYTKLDKDCHVEKDEEREGKPIFAFYWMMNRTTYKRVHSLIQSGIRDRLQVGALEPSGFDVEMTDLKELDSDIKDPNLHVLAEKEKDGSCKVDATIKLGPSDKDRVIHLDSIYSEAKKTFWPPFRRVISVRLDGHDVATGEEVKRTYKAK